MTISKFTNFIFSQYYQIKTDGWHRSNPVLQKILFLVYCILIFPIFIPILLVIRLLRPILLIRFGHLESAGIGHFTSNIEIYLSEKELGLHDIGRKHKDFWYLDKIVCNKYLLSKWSKYFTIAPRLLVKPIDDLNRLIPGGAAHNVPYRRIQDQSKPWQRIDIYNTLNKTNCKIKFSADEILSGRKTLNKMGIKEHDSYVCFMTRDAAFHNDSYDKHLNWPIQTVIPAIKTLNKKGYKGIRMGAKVTDKLKDSNQDIIDYANNGMRTEFLDIFLMSRCKFVISTGTGLDSLGETFRIPTVYFNMSQFGWCDENSEKIIFIPSKFWSIPQKRFLTFREIFELGAHNFLNEFQYKLAEIESVGNDIEEIEAVVLEMEQRISGEWEDSAEDKLLHKRFLKIWPTRTRGQHQQPLKARIGTDFLRSNHELLEPI